MRGVGGRLQGTRSRIMRDVNRANTIEQTWMSVLVFGVQGGAESIGLALRRPPPMSTDDDEESSGKVRRIVLETNRKMKGDTEPSSASKGKSFSAYKGKVESSKGAKGRGASTDTGTCSFQSRGPVKPSLVLEAAPSWADESDELTSLSLLPGRQDRLVWYFVNELMELAVRGDGVVATRTKDAEDTFDVDLDEDDPGA